MSKNDHIALFLNGEEMKDYLKSLGFQDVKNQDFDLILRIHEIHFLTWYSKYNRFGLVVLNERKTKRPGESDVRRYFKEIMIPKPIYTEEEANNLINAIK